MRKHFFTLFVFLGSFLLVCRSPAAEVAAGTRIETRLATPTGSRISFAGDPIQAIVIAPVFVNGQLLIPQGAIISGVVDTVERVGLGLKHTTSGLAYRFNKILLPDEAVPVAARVVEVETAKERVNAQGVIGGIYPTANLSSTVDFYALPLLCMNPEFGVPMLGIKFLIARSPDPEIYFPAGTELILELTASVNIAHRASPENDIGPFLPSEMAVAHEAAARLPEQRTDRGRNHPSDLINILFLGSRDAIQRAFDAAGWSGAQRHSLVSIYGMYHCMVQRMGYRMAPMGNLRLNGRLADDEYQKSLDTFSKRHHVRLWKQGDGGVWLGAATEDVGYRMRTMHLTHASDPLIDNERAKVLNDLAFTGCVAAGTMMTREPSADHQDGSITTDGKIAVLLIDDCQHPRTMPAESTQFGPHGRPRWVQALVALRNDVIRANPVSLGYNTIRGLREHENSRINGSMSAFQAVPQNAQTQESTRQANPQPNSQSNALAKWIRPSVLDAGGGESGH